MCNIAYRSRQHLALFGDSREKDSLESLFSRSNKLSGDITRGQSYQMSITMDSSDICKCLIAFSGDSGNFVEFVLSDLHSDAVVSLSVRNELSFPRASFNYPGVTIEVARTDGNDVDAWQNSRERHAAQAGIGGSRGAAIKPIFDFARCIRPAFL